MKKTVCGCPITITDMPTNTLIGMRDAINEVIETRRKKREKMLAYREAILNLIAKAEDDGFIFIADGGPIEEGTFYVKNEDEDEDE